MADGAEKWHKRGGKTVVKNGGAGGLWFAGFLGALIYFLHFHSGTLWLVILAIIKALFWPAVLVYHLFIVLRV